MSAAADPTRAKGHEDANRGLLLTGAISGLLLIVSFFVGSSNPDGWILLVTLTLAARWWRTRGRTPAALAPV